MYVHMCICAYTLCFFSNVSPCSVYLISKELSGRFRCFQMIDREDNTKIAPSIKRRVPFLSNLHCIMIRITHENYYMITNNSHVYDVRNFTGSLQKLNYYNVVATN